MALVVEERAPSHLVDTVSLVHICVKMEMFPPDSRVLSSLFCIAKRNAN